MPQPPAISLFGRENAIYLALSAILGAWGIVSDQNDVFISAMLISPFFVPIINMHLKGGRNTALINNSAILIVSIIYCVIVGVITAKVLKLGTKPESKTMIKISNWEKTSKEDTIMAYIIPVIVGTLIAVAYKSQNIIPMVGAGIAISILPPFANAGIYFGRNADPSDKMKAFDSLKLGFINITLGALSYFLAITTLRHLI